MSSFAVTEPNVSQSHEHGAEAALLMVSVVIPCRNEEKYIKACLDAVIANDYPQERLEVLVVDGMSDDNTVSIIREYQKEYPFIHLLQNPDKVTPFAFNIGIKHARGDRIMIMSAHAIVQPDYISQCVKYSVEYGADNVGGVRLTKPGDKSVFGRAIAHSISHPFAAGTAVYRTGTNAIKWVDTVFGGCYPRQVFERIGLFDERLAKGQDREFNVRLRQAGGKILMVPHIVTYYYARGDLKVFFRWMWVVGLTPIYMSKVIGRRVFSERNLVPPLFVLWLLFSFALSFIWPILWWGFLGTVGIYLAACLYFSVPIAFKERDVRFLVAMPFIFGATHILYGLGALFAIFKPVKRPPRLSQA